MKTSLIPNPLNRLEVFCWLIAQEVARRGGSSEDQHTANAWTLDLEVSSIPPAIGLAAKQHVDAVLWRPKLPRQSGNSSFAANVYGTKGKVSRTSSRPASTGRPIPMC